MKEFLERIKNYPRLDFNTARIFYQEILLENDINKKKIKREQLINSLLYLIAKEIDNHKLLYIKSSLYDIDDIINTYVELLIKAIDNKELITKNSFHAIFDYKFYFNLESILINNQGDIFPKYQIYADNFSSYFSSYMQIRKDKDNFSYEDFKEFMHGKGSYNTYKLFESMYTLFDNHNITSINIDDIKYLLIESFERKVLPGINNFVVDDSFDNMNFLILLNVVNKELSKLDSFQEKIIRRLYEKEETIQSIADDNNISRYTLESYRKSFLRKLVKYKK